MSKPVAKFLRQFSKMTGDKKIRIAMRLSETVRKVRQEGALATKTAKPQWSKASKIFLSR